MIGKLLAGIALWEFGWWVHGLYDRKRQFEKAQAEARRRGKPLLVVGSPDGQYPCGDVTMDLRDTGECDNFMKGSVEAMSFEDQQFGAVFVSHVLEHTCHPFAAIQELERVADEVYVSYPRPWRIVTWLVPGHTWIMNPDPSARFKMMRIRKKCDIPTYLGERE